MAKLLQDIVKEMGLNGGKISAKNCHNSMDRGYNAYCDCSTDCASDNCDCYDGDCSDCYCTDCNEGDDPD